jgi:hypothetical protein
MTTDNECRDILRRLVELDAASYDVAKTFGVPLKDTFIHERDSQVWETEMRKARRLVGQ